MWEDVCRLYANTKPLYIKDLSIEDFGIHGSVLEKIPGRYRGMTVF